MNCIRIILVGAIIISAGQISAQQAVPLRQVMSHGILKPNIKNRQIAVIQSVGQQGVIGLGKASKHHLRQGYVQPAIFLLNTGESDMDLDITVFPNPLHHVLNISLTEEKSVRVSLIDLKGNTYYSREFEKLLQTELDVSPLKPGAYLLKITTPNHSTSKLLIKK